MSTELLDRAPTLDRRHGLPVHAQIEQWLMDEITHGQIATGDRLPGERALAAALRVSRMTLRQALDGLARRGVLIRLPGRTGGAFVAEPKIDCDLTGLAGFTEQMRRAHRRAGAEVLSARTVAAEEEVAAALRIPVGTAVHQLVRSARRTARRSRWNGPGSRPSPSPTCSTTRSPARSTTCSRSTTGSLRTPPWSTWSRSAPTRWTPLRSGYRAAPP